ncbi:MAG: L-threonylcarbamoyladenylate synthase [Pseudomonadota bacterium]
MGTSTDLEAALRALARPGAVVLYPTETLYGLGGLARDSASALRIAALKGRPPGGLIVLHLAPPLRQPIALALARAFWPGPLTLVVEAWPGLAQEVLGADGTVAVRPPLHPLAVRLVAAAGPMTSTSANRSGQPPLLDPASCRLAVDAVVDGGPLPPRPPSTLVRADDGRVLREGAIPAARVRAALAAMGLP